MKLIGLLVLLSLVSLVEGEVVNSFDTCKQFFVDNIPPTVLTDQNNPDRYKKICQKYKDIHRFATLYDTRNRIPVYSAYTFTENIPLNRNGIPWKIEPQLDDPNEGPDMVSSNQGGNNQALDEDYKSSGYNRGHLYPHCHNCDQNQAESTFTLTNAAPITNKDNIQWYWQVENVIGNMINNGCNQNKPVYVVTGVVPGNKWIDKGNRVNVPKAYWSAVCCTCMKGNNYRSEGYFAATKTGMEEDQGPHPGTDWEMVAKKMTLQELNNKLSNLYGQRFDVVCEN